LDEEYRSLSSSLCSFLLFPVTSSLLDPNIPLSTLLSNILSLRSSLNVSDQVSHPYKTTGRIIVLYVLIFKLIKEVWTVTPKSDNTVNSKGRIPRRRARFIL
jgi:hypothetical protein